MDLLEANGSLPAKYHPHKLSGDMDGIWECHIQPDWLMTWEPIRNSRSSSCEQALTQTCSKLSPSPKKLRQIMPPLTYIHASEANAVTMDEIRDTFDTLF